MITVDPDNGDILFNGFEQGVGVSPHKGLGNMQNVNLNTSTGEALISFERIQDTMSNTVATGSLAFIDSSHVSLSIPNTNDLFKGNWITVSASSNTSELPNGNYYVNPSSGANFELSSYYNTLSYTLPATVNYTIVGGGAGGGTGNSNGAGGGGGGGQVKNGTTTVSAQAYTVTVGAGGATDSSGSSSSALSVTSSGGINGGQGNSIIGGPGGASGSGKAGGVSITSAGSGGGGDSIVGVSASTSAGGAGGTGTVSTISGSSVTYGGGGGGGGQGAGTGAGGTGGTGGGGAGGSGSASSSHPGIAGTVNTGGGGGGGGGLTGGGTNVGGAGGTGQVIIRYVTGSIIGATGGAISVELISNVSYTIHTFNTSGTFTVPTAPATNPLSGFTTGLTATIAMVATMGKPIASATENYFSSGVPYNRYYILDKNNLVWVYDTINEILYSSSDNVTWFLPDFATGLQTQASGLAVIDGFLIATTQTGIWGKPTSLLGNTNSTASTWVFFTDIDGWAGSGPGSTNPHFAYVGHQGALYITDGSYIVEVFPDSTLADPSSTSDPVQVFGSWIATGSAPTEGTLSIIAGTTGFPSDGGRVPVVFFVENGGSLPSSITPGTVYYIVPILIENQFTAYSTSLGGSALDLYTGAIGTQYLNTFYPIASASSWDGETPTYVLTQQRLTLPTFEISQVITEIGNLIMIGCTGNVVYPWNQVDNLPSSIISLPEAGVEAILTVHQMAYIFAGNKGNIYITDGSVASLVTSIPDYCAGIPGSPETYIESYFVWGGVMYLRGRVYFSVLDQTSIKAGNTGGIWSFVPTQNFYIGQDVGIAMRLENQSSYGTYNGYVPVLIPKVNQQAISPQYFSGWVSDINIPLYGIDSTGTFPAQNAIIETDLIPTGTILGQQKKTFTSEEYKLSSPLLSGEDVQLNYRLDLTGPWISCGNVQTDNSAMSGYFTVNFQNSQWVQFQAVMTPNGTSTFSGNRLTEIRLHPSKYDSQ